MIEYDHSNNQMMLNCDGEDCTTMQMFDGDYKYCISEAKAAGWWLRKNDGEHKHYCSSNCYVSDTREFSLELGNMEILK